MAVLALHDDTNPWTDADASVCPHVQIIPYHLTTEEQKPGNYPVNRMRNMGLDAVQTSHILMVDVDFIPSDRLEETIRKTLEQRKVHLASHSDQPQSSESAIVVPAFERRLDCHSPADCLAPLQDDDSAWIPHTFEALRECVRTEDCEVFQSQANWEGHHDTRSAEWLAKEWFDKDNFNDIRRLTCFDSLRYEPYVVLEWCGANAPYYDERFYGYGKNKIEYIAHLRLSGYQFYVLPEGFLVHYPHVLSEAKKEWNNVHESKLHETMDHLYPQFLRELAAKYIDKASVVVQACKHEPS